MRAIETCFSNQYVDVNEMVKCVCVCVLIHVSERVLCLKSEE